MRGMLTSVLLLLVAFGGLQANASVLWNNGSYGGTGTGQVILVSPGYDTLGVVVAGYNTTAAQRNADDFVVPAGPQQWDLANLVVYAYQISSVVNPFSKAYVAIYDADPTGSTNLSPVYGGNAALMPLTAPDRFVSQVDTTDDRGNTTRNIHAVTIDLGWVPDLAAGHYWIAWGLRGTSDNSTVASMPVVPGLELHGPNNGLAWGRSRHTPPGREDFWQYADGTIPSGFQLNGDAVPEPACLALLGCGLLFVARRRTR